MPFVNISAYKFIDLPTEMLSTWRVDILRKAQQLRLKGTVLLSSEGINVFVAGARQDIDNFKQYLQNYAPFADLWYKESISSKQPFSRMLVRLKQEIIAFGQKDVKPKQRTAPHLPPQQLKAWYEQQKDMIVLDTRNTYEVELGSFDQAIHLNLDHFREFPAAAEQKLTPYRDKPIVMFCTGGIRCEKAGAFLIKKGFKQVYQLQGGILHYFEQCGGAHYHGECFVFDQRVALDSQLQETPTRQCFGCRGIVTQSQAMCPSCGETQLIG